MTLCITFFIPLIRPESSESQTLMEKLAVPSDRIMRGPTDGIAPTNETIQSGEYPYVNDFYVVIRKSELKDSKARLLYEWLTSIDAQKLVAGAGYVPVVNVE